MLTFLLLQWLLSYCNVVSFHLIKVVKQIWDPWCHLLSIFPTNLCNVQRCQHKVNGTKDAILFHQHFYLNLTVCFKLQLFRWAPYFGAFLLNAIVIEPLAMFVDIQVGYSASFAFLVGWHASAVCRACLTPEWHHYLFTF